MILPFMSSNTDRVAEVDKSLVEPLLPGIPTGTIESASDAELESLIAARRGPLARFIARCRRAQESTRKSKSKKILLVSLLVLFVILIVVVIVVVVVVTKAKRRRRVSWWPQPQPQEACHQWPIWTTLDEYPVPGPAPRLPYVANTSFNFSRFDDSLYFIDGSLNTFGPKVHGAISFMTDADIPEDKIKVDIIASYESREQFYSLGVCAVQRTFMRRATGIKLAPQWYTGNKRAYFHINVKFPRAKEGSNSPLYFNDVESRLPSFIHRVGDLQHTAQFHSFDISTVSTPILVESLAANKITLRTSNANIKGYFNVTDELSLNTDGDITVSGTMESDGLSECRTSIHSGGLLEANFNLSSTNVERDRGVFSIATSTFGGPTDVVVSSAPIDHILRFSAMSYHGPLRIALPTTYEGPFSLTSSEGSPVLKYDPDPVDPTGRGRNRTVQYSKIGPRPGNGRVFWGSRNRHGSTNLYASNLVANTEGPLTLELL